MFGGVPAQGGVCPGDVCARVCLPGGHLHKGGGCLPRRVSAQGVSAQGGVSQHAMGQTPSLDRQTPVKT